MILFVILIIAFSAIIYLQGIYALFSMMVFFGLFICLLYFRQNQIIYGVKSPGKSQFPKDNSHDSRNPSDQFLKYKDICISTEDGIKLRGWHIQAEQQQNSNIIVYFHENFINIGNPLQYIKKLIDQTNNDVIIVAYRGYSDSEGKPTQRGLQMDAQAILTYALNYDSSKQKDIFIIGRGMGSCVAIYAAVLKKFKNKIKGLIIESAFLSIPLLSQSYFPFLKFFKFLYHNSWNSLQRISQVQCPILFLKNPNTQYPPVQHMHILQKNAVSSPMIAEYNVLFPIQNIYFEKIDLFLSKIMENQGKLNKILEHILKAQKKQQ